MPGHSLNLLLAISFFALQALQLIVVPAWLLPLSPSWGWLLLVPVLLSNAWWAFIHEAIHGAMFPSKRVNRLTGRLHAILFGAAFDLLRWGHLLHHAYSRSPRDRSEVIPLHQSIKLLDRVSYFFRLFGGLYLFEVLGSMLLLLPRPAIQALIPYLSSEANVVAQLVNKLSEPATLRAARFDVLLIITLYSLAFWLYGAHAWMLVLAILGRGLLISLVDNLFHYGTPLQHKHYARNLRLAPLSSALMLHFNLHGTHHLHPNLPWWQLAAKHLEAGGEFQGSWAQAMREQLHGPIPEHVLAASAGTHTPDQLQT